MPARAKLTVREIINELVDRTNSNMRRLREIEKNIDSFDARIDALEKSISEQSKIINNVKNSIGATASTEIKRIENLENTLKEVIEKLKKTPSLTKIKQLETLIEMYNPLKSQFVTKEEVKRLLGKEE